MFVHVHYVSRFCDILTLNVFKSWDTKHFKSNCKKATKNNNLLGGGGGKNKKKKIVAEGGGGGESPESNKCAYSQNG